MTSSSALSRRPRLAEMRPALAPASYAPPPNAPAPFPAAPRMEARDMTAADSLAFRQLRHQTKNALQRLICEIARNGELQHTNEGRAVFAELERRICLTARVSDALFGLTEQPGPFLHRLQALCAGTVGLLIHHGQLVDHDVRIEGVCPPHLEDQVLKIAHEMIGNAVKHGMRGRTQGRVTVRVIVTQHRLVMSVIDDGPGVEGHRDTGGMPVIVRNEGEGFSLMRDIAEQIGGTVVLRRERGMTVAELNVVTGHVRAPRPGL